VRAANPYRARGIERIVPHPAPKGESMKRLAAAIAAALPVLALAETSTWNMDPAHTEAGFSVRHFVISTVKGSFGKTTGKVQLDDKDITKSSVEATIEVASVDTRVQKRDDDLRSANFFDAAKYPTITFRSTKVEKSGDGLKVTGDLTMKGVTRPVTLDVAGPTPEIKDPFLLTFRRGLSARTKLNRKDFGVAYAAMVEAGPVVSDEVHVEINAELVKAK
jgi:polyisoprenoid-binding protein YceI